MKPISLMMCLLAFSILTHNHPGFAEVELKEKGDDFIRIGQPQGDSWVDQDEVCIVRDGQTVDCGKVTQSESDSAIVRLSNTEEVLPGDRVQSYLEIEDENTHALITGGLMAGFGYYFPHLHLQYKLSESWFVGLMGSLSSSQELGKDISSKGIFLTANHYARRVPFRNFWFRAGAGVYMLDVTSSLGSETSTSPALLSTVGWRGYIGKTFNVGLGVGLQYLPEQIKSVPLGLRNLEPLMTLDIGIRF